MIGVFPIMCHFSFSNEDEPLREWLSRIGVDEESIGMIGNPLNNETNILNTDIHRK
jgi:hypothetical protein